MPHGTHHDETGWLGDVNGQLILRRDDGGRWRLDVGFFLAFQARRLVGKQVRVIGTRDGFDVLAVKRIIAL